MATISKANFEAITDSIAKQYSLLAANIGTTGTPGTAAYGAAQNLARVLALGDKDQLLALLGPADAQQGAIVKGAPIAWFAPMIRALRDHVGGSFDAYCQAQGTQVAPEFRDASGGLVSNLYVFPPVVDPICTFSVTGSGAGTRTGVSSIDTTLYGPAQFEVVTTTAIGAQAINATLTLVKFDGTTETKNVTINASSGNGTVVAVGTATDLYVNCTAITITGGTSGESFKVRSKLRRTIAL
jgi:hypothetical protein